ncbi:MAG: amphi-Trp domain-containing protein [Candidatus Nanohaloarchaea archaeon]|jgi:amphi-Trp domain-containing protein
MNREDAAEKLHTLADKISEGQVELKAENDSVTLQPADYVEFELDVEKEDDGDISIEIEIEWPERQSSGDIEIQ